MYQVKCFWDVLKRISLILAILSSVITIVIFLDIKNIQDVLEPNNPDNFEIRLFEPKLSNSSIRMDGYIRSKKNVKSVISELKKANLQVFSLIQENNNDKWKIWHPPLIQKNGDFLLEINSQSSVEGFNQIRKVIVITCAKNALSEGVELPYVPLQLYDSISNQISITK